MAIRFGNAVFEDNKAWCVPQGYSAIVEIDLITRRSKVIARLDGYEIFDQHMCKAIQKNGEYIAVAPDLGEYFYLFNKKNFHTKKFSIKEYVKERNYEKNQCKFFDSFCRGKYIYFIGGWYPGIVKIDIEKEELKVIELNLEKNKYKAGGILGRKVCVVSNHIYIPLINKKEILVFNLESEQYKILKIGNECSFSLCGDGDNLYLLPETNRNIEVYNLNLEKIKSKLIFPSDMQGVLAERWYSAALFHCGYIWVFPFKSNMILRLDPHLEEAICVKRFDIIDDIKYTNIGIYDENHIWGFYQKCNRLDMLNCHTLQIESKNFIAPCNVADFVAKEEIEIICAQGVREEYFGIENFLLIMNYEMMKQKSDRRTDVGLNIWKQLKNSI